MLAWRLIRRGCFDFFFVPALAWITWLGRGAFFCEVWWNCLDRKSESFALALKRYWALAGKQPELIVQMCEHLGCVTNFFCLLLTLLYPRSRVFHPVLNQVTT